MLKNPVNQDDHIQGNPNASVTLVEYGDYQCGDCGAAYPIIKRVQKHFEEKLKFVFRNFPLVTIHSHAHMAAEAAEFAATQGRFWEMHDLIYEHQQQLSLEKLVELGNQLQLSSADLKQAIQNHTFESKVKKDFLGGIRSGINGTPTFFINDQRYEGPARFEPLKSAIESALNSSK